MWAQQKSPQKELRKLIALLEKKSEPKENEKGNLAQEETKKGKKAQGKERWKQEAREKGKAQELVIPSQAPSVGKKRGIKLEEPDD